MENIMKETTMALEALFERAEDVYHITCDDSYLPFVKRRCRAEPLYQKAIERHNEKQNDKNKPYFEHLVNELYVFSLYMRRTPVKRSRGDVEGTILDSRDKLYLLRSQTASDGLQWPDSRLYLLFKRTNRVRGRRVRTYAETFDDVGQDKEVVQLWNGPIVYQRDIFYILRNRKMRRETK